MTHRLESMVKLSIIVPVYNVEPYLRKCVDSLIAQDYEDYEIILVDDGSTDESGAICDEYAASSLSAAGMSPFSEAEPSIIPIRVIHQQNSGLSAARNAGIKCANGEYLCFVDSDDYWEPDVLGGLMEQVEREELDVLRFDYQNVRVVDAKHIDAARLDSSNLAYEVFEPNKTPRYIDKCNEIVDGETYLNTRMGYACYAWQFIICKDIVNTFYEGIHFEDTEWLPRMMLAAKRVNSTTTVVYNYLVRQGSITKVQGDRTKIRKNLEDSILIIDRYRQYREQHSDCTWLYNMQSSMAAGVLTTMAREFYAERREYIARLRKMNVFPLRIADQGRTYKRRATIINAFGPKVYCALIKIKELVS